jgi:hypothetical protein
MFSIKYTPFSFTVKTEEMLTLGRDQYMFLENWDCVKVIMSHLTSITPSSGTLTPHTVGNRKEATNRS